MRSVEQITDNFRIHLSNLNSQLQDFKKYGSFYFIVRAIATVLNEQETNFELLLAEKSVATATGTNLDLLAAEYGLIRNPGRSPTGVVLARSSNQTNISEGTILTDASGLNRFRINNDALVTTEEVSLAVEYLDSAVIFLAAGTELFSQVYPQVEFIVGLYRDIDNQPQGAIEGGIEPETDDSLRTRIYLSKLDFTPSTLDDLTDLINELNLVNRMYVVNNSPRVGFFTLYLDTDDQNTKAEIADLIDSSFSLGTSYLIKSLNILYLDFNLKLSLTTFTNIENTKVEIANTLNNYFLSVEPGSLVKTIYLEREILTLTNINKVEFLNLQPDIQLDLNQLPKLNNLTINLDL